MNSQENDSIQPPKKMWEALLNSEATPPDVAQIINKHTLELACDEAMFQPFVDAEKMALKIHGWKSLEDLNYWGNVDDDAEVQATLNELNHFVSKTQSDSMMSGAKALERHRKEWEIERDALKSEIERLTDLLHSIANETDYRNIRGTIERELKR